MNLNERIKALNALKGIVMATFGKKPWMSAADQMSVEVGGNGNSLTPRVHGRVVRVSSSEQDWDMSKEWRGRELTSYVVKKSNWTKGYSIMYYIETPSGNPCRLHTFTLWLEDSVTPEEAEGAALSYMMALNMRRVE